MDEDEKKILRDLEKQKPKENGRRASINDVEKDIDAQHRSVVIIKCLKNKIKKIMSPPIIISKTMRKYIEKKWNNNN